jgi:hypothetical protein
MKSTPNKASRRGRRADSLARGLGWFSIGLGLAELLAPRAMARATGMKGGERVLQAYGLREIATGVALLKASDPRPWLWARVAGDALDLTTLGVSGRPRRMTTAMSLAAVAGVTALDVATARMLQADVRRAARPVRDYSDRRGFPMPPQAMRGAARSDFQTPADMRTPPAMAAYT